MKINAHKQSVNPVSVEGFCTGCGSCELVCPVDAVKLKETSSGGYEAEVSDSCIDCGKCAKVCPPLNWNNSNLLQAEKYHPKLGGYLKCFSGHAVDEELRFSASSGGVLSALLINALKNNVITGAVVTIRPSDKLLRPKAVIARTPEEIESAAGSKYTPVDWREVNQQLSNLSDEEKIAVVGLPCNLQALELMKDKIKAKLILIGMVCGGTAGFGAYDYLMRKLNINTEKLEGFSNRGNGWPGYMTIDVQGNDSIRYPYRGKLAMGSLLSSPWARRKNCQYCRDPLGFCADISVSDAWLERFGEDKCGHSLILVKSGKGAELIEKAGEALALNPTEAEDFILANKRIFEYKVNALEGFKPSNGKIQTEHGIGFSRYLKLRIFLTHINIMRRFTPLRSSGIVSAAALKYGKLLNILKY